MGFSIMNEDAQRLVPSGSLSRASSTGENQGSINHQKLPSADQKMLGSNLYWEEEDLEVSRAGSDCHNSSRGFLEAGSEVKSALPITGSRLRSAVTSRRREPACTGSCVSLP